jgi:hypothetical protein
VKIDDFRADGWVCEQHPDQPWPHPDPTEPDGQCAGPGMLHVLDSPAVSLKVLQRFTSNGQPKELRDLFRLTENRRSARARPVHTSTRMGTPLAHWRAGNRAEPRLPHPGRRADDGRTVEGCDAREGVELTPETRVGRASFRGLVARFARVFPC